MKPTILVAAPLAVARKLAGELLDVTAETVDEPARAAALIEVGTYGAIVVLRGFVHPQARFVIVAGTDEVTLSERVTAAVIAHRSQRVAEGAAFAAYAQLPYNEFMELIRTRETRRYPIALLTHAARAAGVMRESLHRLLRRYDLDAEAFRSRG
ncbi:MAG TPA: hypothetical protein VK427_22940 [Kofleriaceae bacterium]|nr:hypothetical protein [Kofleriaceae bacterium]